MDRPIVTLIAAVSSDGFISRERGIPWDLPRDRAFFRQHTAGRWLLLGRTTYDEMTGWFVDHTPLVLSRDNTFQPSPGYRVNTVPEAIAMATAAGVDELMVCGGGQVYALALPYAQKLLITRVDTALGGGVPFPVLTPKAWCTEVTATHPPDAQHAFALRFETLTRARQDAPES